MAEPAHTEQSLARAERAPDEGRCRADPHCTRDGSGRQCCCCSNCTHIVVRRRSCRGAGDPPRGGELAPGCRPAACSAHNDKLMSYSQARKVAEEVTYANAVERPNGPTSTTTCPCSRRSRPRRTSSRRHGCRQPSAKRAGTTTRMPATSASSSGTALMATRLRAALRPRCKLAWEAAHGQGPPDAPGECHSY